MLFVLVIACAILAGCQSDIKNPPPMKFSSRVEIVDETPALAHTGPEVSGGTGQTRNNGSCL
jgi:hypothetical protein